MKHIAKEFMDMQFLRYAIIGITGVIIDFILFLILVKIGVPAVIASIVSVSIAIVNNFLLNAYLNFKKKDHLWWRFLSFYTVGATGVVLSALFIVLFHNIIGISEIYAKLLSVPFIVVFQYLFNKYASFAEDSAQIPWRQLAIFCACILILTIFAANAPYYNFTDENDNLLGAQLIAQDQLIIYKEYFSHHMPLTYFIAAPLFLILGTNLIAIKVVFGICMGLWLLMMSRHLLFKFGIKIFIAFTGLVAISQTLAWSHMLLAETLIGFALCHALILFITRDAKSRNKKIEGVTYALLACIPVMSSLSYAPISIFIYLMWFWRIIENRKSLTVGTLVLYAISALLPYILFVSYLVATHSLSEFKEQAVTFNTLYYSQYSTDAPTSKIDAALSIIQGSFGSLYNTLTDASFIVKQPLSFIFTVCLLASLAIVAFARKWLYLALFGGAIILSASRGGFTAAFSNNDQARAGIILSIIGLLLCTYAIHLLLSLKSLKKSSLRYYVTPLFVIGGTILITASVTQVSTILRDYSGNKNTVKLNEEPGSPSTVINAVNNVSDYYWIGPIDFSSQVITKSNNASKYRFYPPWVYSCNSCSQELIKDIQSTKPKVIALNTDMTIWGHNVGSYTKDLVDSLDNRYYQIDSDARLKHFYFLKEDMNDINTKLEKAGYEL